MSDVAEHIRIRSVYLAAIEDENWSAIGAPVYTRGFLRTYARYLGLDSEEMVAAFNASSGAAASPSTVANAQSQSERAASAVGAASGPSGRRGFSPLLWIAAAVAVVLIAFVVYNEMSLHAGGMGTVAQASPSPTPAPTESPLASATPGVAPHTMELTLSAPSWLRVTVDGSVSMEGTFPAGTAKSFHGNVVVLRAGNAGGVHVLVNGVDAGKLGATGDVVERSFPL